MILEGGSIDVNGSGALLTSESCLLNKNRNPNLSRDEIEQRLRDYLGVSDILWLGDGIAGDDTDGHIDDLTRFVCGADSRNCRGRESRRRKLRTASGESQTSTRNENRRSQTRYPHASDAEEDVREGLRLPASYANFYIANTCVLVPTFADPNDEAGLSFLRECFPDRRVIGIDCRELIWGLGSFHCLTQQEPAV